MLNAYNQFRHTVIDYVLKLGPSFEETAERELMQEVVEEAPTLEPPVTGASATPTTLVRN